MECKLCKNTFVSKTSLKHHQKTAKYCLKLQGNKIKKYVCQSCNKDVSTKYRLQTHYQTCENFSKDKLKIEYEQLLEEKDILIDSLTKQIQQLQETIENIAIKAVQRPTTTNNTMNKTQINNFIQNMQPLTSKHLVDHAPHLTIEHVQKGASGYAEYALEYPLKDRVACVDYARRKIKFKDQKGNIVTRLSNI